jgi:O-antigen/teichoic acid export membrane protein
MFWRGVLGYLPANAVQGVIGLLNIIVFTRVLPPEAYGAYALGFSVMSLVHTVMFTWLESAMARFHAPEAKAGALAEHFATLLRTYVVLAVTFPMAAAAVLYFWPMRPDLKLAIAAGLASIVFRSLAKIIQEGRRAAGDVGGAARLDMLQTIGGFALGAGLAVIGFGGGAPLAGMGAASAVSLIFVLPSGLRQARGGRWQAERIARYAHYALPISLSLILSLVLATTDRFLLAGYLNETAVGVYHAGYSVANRTLDVVFYWLGMAGGPAAVAALEHGGRAALERAAREQATLMIAVTLPAAIGLALVAHPLAELMIGPALRDGAARVTPWIAASAFFSGMTTYYLHMAFTLSRRTTLLFVVMAMPAAANLGFNLLLIPCYGLDGAMWSTTGSFVLGAVASYTLGRRALALPLPWATLGRCLAAAVGMAMAVLALPALGGVVELALKAGVGAVVYGALAWLLDAGGARDQSRRLIGLVQSRLPA